MTLKDICYLLTRQVKVIAVYDAASNCLTSAYKQKKLSLLYPYNGKRSDAKHFFHWNTNTTFSQRLFFKDIFRIFRGFLTDLPGHKLTFSSGPSDGFSTS